MTVILRHSEKLELNLVEYQGAVSLAELKALAAFNARSPEAMSRDALNIITPGTHFSVLPEDLDSLFAYYRKLFSPLKLEIMRRAAWVCHSAAADGLVRHWLAGDVRKGMSTSARLFGGIVEAADWLMLRPEETAAIRTGEGFIDIARFNALAPAR